MTDKDPSDRSGLTASFELVTKIGAPFLGLAYISGYLIVNTYLSSFGINGDAIQVFKSKYVYVGFLYVLLLLSVVLMFTVVKKAWDLAYFYAHPAATSDEKPKVSIVNLETTNIPPPPMCPIYMWTTQERDRKTSKLKEWSFMLWVLLVAALVIPINVELILFNSNSYKDHMVVQFALLCAVILYQVTYYRAYRDEEWDKDSWSVFWRRACCVVSAGAFIGLLWARRSLREAAYWYGQHPALGILLFALATVALLWLFRILFLTSDERKLWEAGDGPSWTWSIPSRSWFLVFVLPVVTGLIAIITVPYWFRWWLIQNVGLFLAISVLGGVIVFSIQANKQREKEGLPHETTTTERL